MHHGLDKVQTHNKFLNHSHILGIWKPKVVSSQLTSGLDTSWPPLTPFHEGLDRAAVTFGSLATTEPVKYHHELGFLKIIVITRINIVTSILIIIIIIITVIPPSPTQ